MALDITSNHASLLHPITPPESATPPPAHDTANPKKSSKSSGRKKKGSETTPLVSGESAEMDEKDSNADGTPPKSKRAKLGPKTGFPDKETTSMDGKVSPSTGGSKQVAKQASKRVLVGGSTEVDDDKETATENTPRYSKRIRSTSKTDSDDAAPPEGTSKSSKRVKPASKTGLSEEYRMRRLSVACTACAWLPTLLQVNCEVVGVVAMATRTGHVTLLGVKLPIVLGE